MVVTSLMKLQKDVARILMLSILILQVVDLQLQLITKRKLK